MGDGSGRWNETVRTNITAPRCSERTVLVAKDRPLRTISTEYITGIVESPLPVSTTWKDREGKGTLRRSMNVESVHGVLYPLFSELHSKLEQ